MGTVRKPTLRDAKDIKALLDGAWKNGNVLRRPIIEIYESIRDFVVYENETGIAGCVALHADLENLAEIRSLVVREDLRGTGVGRQLVQACIEEADELGVARVYALTRTQPFFERLGFIQVAMDSLPHKVFSDCMRCPSYPDCDEVAMICDIRPYVPHAF